MGIHTDNIFNLFDDRESSEGVVGGLEGLENTSKHPLILAYIFTRLVLRGEEVSASIAEFFYAAGNYTVPIEEYRAQNSKLIFDRAMLKLIQIDIDDQLHLEILAEKVGEDFYKACALTIGYYTEQEEYEKCAFIKEIQDSINFLQKKLPS